MRNPTVLRMACVFTTFSIGDSGKYGVVDMIKELKIGVSLAQDELQ
jgi:hypothetical protein